MGLKKDEVKKPDNSSMTTNGKDIKEHGKTMENLDTNQQVKEKGFIPDPQQ